jgi:chemotaxis protein methyltransferase CheR
MSQTATISDRDYRRLTGLIRDGWGLEFPPGKRIMVETRLGKRARLLGLGSLSAYCDYLLTEEGRRQEAEQLIDAVTTHKTDFFREPAHFGYLTSMAIPELGRRYGAGIRQPLEVWSSACSTGEEPYTIAMVLAEYARSIDPRPFRFHIEATDISSVVLETGATGVYPANLVEPVPEAMKREYLLRGRDPERPRVRVVPRLRAAVTFRQLNLLDADYGFDQPLDIVFCRNVMIYFDRPTQQRVLRQIIRTLRPGGYLMMGHAESLNGMDLPLEQATPTVYRRRDG